MDSLDLMAPVFGARRHSAAEYYGGQRNFLGDRQVSFVVQSEGHDGEGAHGNQSEGEGSEGEEDWKAPQNPFR